MSMKIGDFEPKVKKSHLDEFKVRDERVGPDQAPPGFIATSILQDTLAHMLNFLEGMNQAGILPNFHTAPAGGTFQKVVDTAKDVEYMRLQEFGDVRENRSRNSGSYNGTSSRGRVFSAKSFRPPSGRPIQAAIQSSKGGYFVRGFYSSGQVPQGYSQISSRHRGYFDHSRSNQ
ncbi:hypothetical protein HAX54_041495 [Datura stramonium]|uniref:Uncharacterized protein n=1 Tax=Datura stramonium TaxID=4076 RepID=A0ABS8VTC8_DATST|nr:hypothetical protein [Datura stramonium]